MARCGCANNCNCVVTGGCGANVTGTGNPGAPYVVSADIDDASDNQLSCVPDAEGNPGGLYVPPPTVVVGDTDCINMSGVGTVGSPITAVPILDDDECNLLSCGPDGLLAAVVVGESDCASLTGCGSEDDPLIPEVRLSPDEGNTLSCRANGLYIGELGAGAIDIHGSMGLTAAAQNTGGTTSDNSLGLFPWDVVTTDIGSITDVANSRFVIPVGGSGWYHVKAKWVESTATDSFEANSNFVQVRATITSPGNHLIAQTTHAYMAHLNQSYYVEGVVYLAAGDIVTSGLLIETGGIANVLQHDWDNLAYSDGSFPCSFEIQRIGV